MAAYDLEEQDKIDDLKLWWKRFGNTITTGVVIGALVIVGVQGWRWYSSTKAEQASAFYSAVADAVRKNEVPRARDSVTQLEDKYASTAYAPRGALVYARLLYDSGDKAGAKQQLQWVIDHTTEDELKAVALYRLAQALVDEKQYDQALATLDAKHPESFDGLFADLRGDALAGAGRAADARSAYQLAVSKLDQKSQYIAFVRVKLDALGGPAPGAAATLPGAAPAAAKAGAAKAASAPPAVNAAPTTAGAAPTTGSK